MRRIFFPVAMGLIGCAVLVSLGIWQMQRLAWKESMLARIEARIGDAPGSLPANPDPDADEYMPVRVSGQFAPGAFFVIKGRTGQSPVYRVIVPLQLETRKILADLGTVPQRMFEAQGPIEITGNLHWPDETSNWTPAPDGDQWFARDVPAMAVAFGTEPIMVVARQHSRADLGTTPIPVSTHGIPNDHLGYAITWFGLAIAWAVMSFWLIRRTLRSAP